MPKYRITFTYSEEDSIDIEAADEKEAMRIYPFKLHGFGDVEFQEIECLDPTPEGRCKKTPDMFEAQNG